MKPNELRQKAKASLAEARKLDEAAKAENRSFTPEEEAAFDGHIAEYERLTKQAERAERFEQLDAQTRSEGNGQGNDPLPHEDPANTRNGRHAYSLMKVMRQQMKLRLGQGGPLDGIELETHQELAKRRAADNQESPKGVLIPWSLMVDTAASNRFADRNGIQRRTSQLDTSTGAGSIPTILEASMIELLRARMVTRNLGARVMEGMRGLFAIPRQSGPGTFYMLGEAGAVTASNQTIDQVPFTPRTGGALTDYTRRFLEQTNQDAEQFVRDDLVAIVARGVEGMAFTGSGSGNQPTGLLNNAGITAPVTLGTNGGDPTWDALVALESSVAIANADMGSLAYCMDAATRGKLKRTLKVSGSTFPIYLWDTQMPEAPVNGYPCGITNLMPSNLTEGTGTNLHAILYGNWNDLIYAFWTGIDLLVDPYTGSSSGNVRIVALQDFDLNVRHPESFRKLADVSVA